MSQYLTDFSNYAAGRAPGDWTERWVTGGQRLSIESAEGALGGQVLRHVIEQGERRAWSWDEVEGADDVEVLARMRASDDGARLGVIARGSGQAPQRGGEYGWTSEIDFGGRCFRTCSYDQDQTKHPERPHGVGAILGDTAFRWYANEWYLIRLRVWVVDGFVAMRARVWADTEAEPDTWTHADDRSDPAHLGANGWVGITGQTDVGIREYDFFSVGTDGDEAPMP